MTEENKNIMTTLNRKLGTRTIRRFALLIMIMTLVFGLLGCAKDAAEIAEDKGGVTAQMVIENPDAYIGKTVTVSGDVEEIHGPKAFNMDSGTSIGELLIVGREPFPNLADANDRVYVINDVATVTGVVKKFVMADVEKEIGWTLDPNIFSGFEGKPVLVANSVGFKPGKETATTATDNNADKTVADKDVVDNKDVDGKMTNKDADTVGETISDLTIFTKEKNRAALVGHKMNLEGVEVNRIVGPHTFTIGSGDDELYVMLDDNAARAVGSQGKIDKGKKVNVSGTIEKLTMEQINDVANDRFRKLTETERDFMKNAKEVYLNVNEIKLAK
ncbi:MAG: hypothetical protein M3405_16420 [Acidobacteriota bacterium]|jgi:hypothetical protein|nr:hypothetical protein [Acidobacteriota bacterium]